MRPPRFWDGGLDPRAREAAPLTRALLTPFAAIYAYFVARRIARTRPAEAGVPVICVGNLTLGGVGKTPLVAAIRARLAAKGLRVASLSRGYSGRKPGPLQVNTVVHSARDVGDEPLMLAASGEAWIARDRAAGAKAMARDGVELIVMDDGHQNPSLAKALSLVVMDAKDPVGNGHVFPKGPLREPVAAGLARADAIVMVGEGPVPNWLSASDLPVLRAKLQPTQAVPEGPLVAFAGIGRPEKLFDGLKSAGAELRDAIPYPDHHTYNARDLAYLRHLASDHGARLITTEKDVVRLPADMRTEVLAWPVDAVFADPTALDHLLELVLEPASHG